ncbi:hypothetical protein [Actinoplanes solisilvae]|uniref:hypothetical protein n=1 Tax=Actinoplanes solisilvae TaxID=2486853 RepID=UPI000FD84BE6|nr:hypothetical protein [Actinoplanes solisilvae]
MDTTARRKVALLLAASAFAAGCSTLPAQAERDESFGPEWGTAQRHGSGAADDTPADLTASTVEEHETYDRLVLSFRGARPGYTVRYSDATTLLVTLRDVRDGRGGTETPRLRAVDEVRRAPSAAGMSRTSMILSEADLPFRVGLDVGVFYVDVAHPGAAPS